MVIWVKRCKALREERYFGGRLLDGYARLQAPCEIVVRPRVVWVSRVTPGNSPRKPHGRESSVIKSSPIRGPSEARGHHADDLCGLMIQNECLSDDSGVAAELTLPGLVTQNGDGRSAGLAILVREHPAEQRPY